MRPDPPLAVQTRVSSLGALGWRSSHPCGSHIGGLRCRDPEKFDLGRTDRDVGDACGADRRIRLRQ